jgi:hypothetical protein
LFTGLINSLSQGKLPPTVELRARFKAALIKKNGVLQQPFLCRSNDKKINPAARDMLWAAIILEDRQGVKTVQAILMTELLDRGESKNKTAEVLSEFIEELVDQAPDDKFRQILNKKINNILI